MHFIRPSVAAKKGSALTPILSKRLFWSVSNPIAFVVEIVHNTRRRLNLIPLPITLIVVNTICAIKVHWGIVEIHWGIVEIHWRVLKIHR
jgi:hypothetical protein